MSVLIGFYDVTDAPQADDVSKGETAVVACELRWQIRGELAPRVDDLVRYPSGRVQRVRSVLWDYSTDGWRSTLVTVCCTDDLS